MSSELPQTRHVAVLPQDQLVVAEAVRGHELFVGVAPLDGAHLGVRGKGGRRARVSQGRHGD